MHILSRIKNISKLLNYKQLPKFYSNTKKNLQNVEIDKIRNIGILAHIDAGKTTTTERMLYYSGIIQQMGEVHHGNTVTDYMEQERERGITIQSAAIQFNWKCNQFNLIDTPGHIDFTMEVEQTLNVLDGCIVVLDGSAGVEAQTLTVWRQADGYNIPRLIFINKMDRKDANFDISCKTIEDKLQIPVIKLQMPLIDNRGIFIGVVDIITMEKIIYNTSNNNDVRGFIKNEINEQIDGDLYHQVRLARANIVDQLSGFNDELANQVITSESLDKISIIDICKAIRNVTLNQQAVPVLMGSAYKNIGIQPLMDSVILYLPSPNQRNGHFVCFDGHLCARAFKIKHDKQKGPLSFFRIYNGTFTKGQKVYNIQQNQSEQTGRLYVAYADDFKEVDIVTNGNIAVVSGLKKTMSGDLLTDTQTAAQKAKNKMLKFASNKYNSLQQDNVEHLFGNGPRIPEPVFFCSIEPPSLAYQSALEQALNELQREDPSLRIEYDIETGQTVLSGMGELHLDIIKDRILKEYKIDAELGTLQIAYRESPIDKITDTITIDTKIGNSRQMVNVKLSLISIDRTIQQIKNDLLKLDKTSEAASNLATVYPKHLLAIKQGVQVGLAHGPKIGAPVINTEIILHHFEVGRGTSETMITATVTQLVQRLLNQAKTSVLEPIMFVEIVTPDEHLSAIMADLSRRRSEIQNVTIRGNTKVITANIPLVEILGYSTTLRTISSGTASFTMEFSQYQTMSPNDENAAIRKVRGF